MNVAENSSTARSVGNRKLPVVTQACSHFELGVAFLLMKLDVSAGQTKAPAGTVLVPLILGDHKTDRVFLLIQSHGKPEGTGTLKQECVHVLTHAVLEGEGDAYTRLESALKELNGLLKGFLLSAAVTEVHAIVGVLEQGGTLHLSHVGRSEAYLIRDGTAAQITEYSRGKPPVAFMHIVSGPLADRDNILISTQRLLRSFTPAQLSQTVLRGGNVVEHIVSELESEKEVACIVHVSVRGTEGETAEVRQPLPVRRAGSRRSEGGFSLASLLKFVQPAHGAGRSSGRFASAVHGHVGRAKGLLGDFVGRFQSDLKDPVRKRKAHLLLLAGAAALFLVLWVAIQLTLSSQRTQTREELKELVAQINADIATSENRQLTGDTDSANAILARAEDRARQITSNDSGLYRSEALELLDRIKSKREEMNKVVRITSPRVMANLSARKSDIVAQGFLGFPNGEFLVYDRQDVYRVSLNSVDAGDKLSQEELVLDGVFFPRFQTRVFLTTGNSVLEVSGGQTLAVKTEDPKGWVTGADIKTYLRYLYILAPERKQIYKYERLAGKYGPPAEYNVSGDLAGAIDMTITGPVYVLKDMSADNKTAVGAREVTKLLRGEKQAFTIRNLPPDALSNTTKIFKSSATGNLYFLDPDGKRVVVTSNDGDLGDSLYLKQYVLDAEQVTKLKDIYVDPDDTQLYILDEKKLYTIDLQG